MLLLQGAMHLLLFPVILTQNIREEALSLSIILKDLYWRDLGILSAINQTSNGDLAIQLTDRVFTIPLEQVYSAFFIPFAAVAVPIVFLFWLRFRHAWTFALLMQVVILTLCIYLFFNHGAEYLYLVMGVSVMEVAYLNLYELRVVFNQT